MHAQYSVLLARDAAFFRFCQSIGLSIDGFVGCIDLTYFRDSLTNILIQVFIIRPSLFRKECLIAPTNFFMGGVYISLLCPSSTCVCICAVSVRGYVIDLPVQGWASTSSLLCLVTGNNVNTDNLHCPPVSLIYPVFGMGDCRREIKNTSDTLTLFRQTVPIGNRTQVASVIGHRPSRL